MIPFKDDIRKWFQEGVEKGATHVIVFRDLTDKQYKKVFVFKDEDPRKVYKEYNDWIRYDAAECYSLRKNIEEQFNNQGLVHNFD